MENSYESLIKFSPGQRQQQPKDKSFSNCDPFDYVVKRAETMRLNSTINDESFNSSLNMLQLKTGIGLDISGGKESLGILKLEGLDCTFNAELSAIKEAESPEPVPLIDLNGHTSVTKTPQKLHVCDDKFNDSLLIEARHIASKIENSMDDSFNGNLDDITPPMFKEIEEKCDQNSPQKTEPTKIIPSSPKIVESESDAITSRRTLARRFSSPHRRSNIAKTDANEILHNLSSIINEQTRSSKQIIEGQNLLLSLADILSADKSGSSCEASPEVKVVTQPIVARVIPQPRNLFTASLPTSAINLLKPKRLDERVSNQRRGPLKATLPVGSMTRTTSTRTKLSTVSGRSQSLGRLSGVVNRPVAESTPEMRHTRSDLPNCVISPVPPGSGGVRRSRSPKPVSVKMKETNHFVSPKSTNQGGLRVRNKRVLHEIDNFV